MAANLDAGGRKQLEEELSNMPKRVLSAIMSLVAGEMQGLIDETDPEETKKAKK
ncbi:unnamed protein product [marine sediment metagenome]|uniref:Uncharacterized protein n=1 Tax=marine sediment metagenome TaxID=412755 RepID=X0UV16_9ZZZZ